MSKLNSCILLVFIMSLSGCAATLTQAGSRVRVITGDPPANCTDLGIVRATLEAGLIPNYASTRTSLRNETARKGGNVVKMVRAASAIASGVMIPIYQGVAYRCPKQLESRISVPFLRLRVSTLFMNVRLYRDGHWVVVDGIADDQNLLIRHPVGSSYRLPHDEFAVLLRNMVVVFETSA